MKKTFLLLLLLLPLAHAIDCSQPTNCGGNVLCILSTGLPKALDCAIVGTFRGAWWGPVAWVLKWASVTVTTSPSISGADPFFQDVLYLVSLLFLPVLAFNGLKLVYSSALSASERLEAREELKRAAINMFLVWLCLDVYSMATDAANAVSLALAPSQADWLAALNGASVFSFLLLLLLGFSLYVFFFTALSRWVFSYIGLYLLLFSLVFECFSPTRGIGKALRSVVVANFVVQIVQAFFLRLASMVMAGLITTANGITGLGLNLVIVSVVLSLASASAFLIYSAALLSAIKSTEPAPRYLFYLLKLGGLPNG